MAGAGNTKEKTLSAKQRVDDLKNLKIPKPKLILGGKTYTAPVPKAGVWRKITAYNQIYADTPIQDFNTNDEAYEAVLQLIVDCYTNAGAINDEISVEKLEQELNLEEVMPAMQAVTGWIAFQMQKWAFQLPEKNAVTER